MKGFQNGIKVLARLILKQDPELDAGESIKCGTPLKGEGPFPVPIIFFQLNRNTIGNSW